MTKKPSKNLSRGRGTGSKRAQSGKIAYVDPVILDHYGKEASQRGLEPTSTMFDLTTRNMEVDAIMRCTAHALNGRETDAKFLDAGCGNGYLLEQMRKRFPFLPLTGADYTPEMVGLASERGIQGCEVRREDVQSMGFADASFDVVVTERSIVNVRSKEGQAKALRELHRVLKPGGHLIFIECFLDGLTNLNRARTELGLQENVVPNTNIWFEPERFLSIVKGLFHLMSPAEMAGNGLPTRNFLSTHYFISRVLYPAISKREIIYNTEFVKFFRFLPPEGNHSPIQLCFLKKLG